MATFSQMISYITEAMAQREADRIARMIGLDVKMKVHLYRVNALWDYQFAITTEGHDLVGGPLYEADVMMSLDDFSCRVIEPWVRHLAKSLIPMPRDDCGEII